MLHFEWCFDFDFFFLEIIAIWLLNGVRVILTLLSLSLWSKTMIENLKKAHQRHSLNMYIWRRRRRWENSKNDRIRVGKEKDNFVQNS